MQSGDDGVVVHRPIGVPTWAQLASEEIVLLVVGSELISICQKSEATPNAFAPTTNLPEN
uniref:Uncharacterized protein n=1 Tax=Oryza meridionalis TaxID=40149 RepID=A0A0E0FCN4_9ORYZ